MIILIWIGCEYLVKYEDSFSVFVGGGVYGCFGICFEFGLI